MISWQTILPIPLQDLEKYPLLSQAAERKTLQADMEKLYCLCPITNAGYDGLHIFLWGLCCNSPDWKINPYEPELMGCGWMSNHWRLEDLPQLLELLDDIHTDVAGSVTSDEFKVNSPRIILPAHEEEVINVAVRPRMKEVIHGVRSQPIVFDTQQQLMRLRLIHQFVLLCQEHNTAFVVKHKYSWRK
jgi:hypothetical protein